ncbi:hypothetical protein PR048_033095 [Dryococelus australis]|uniref:Uncharacterized protein n=1 Tax=Dryococelus australis TaxID=614101 RepID=A0ABQ9FZA6_9NEOP|nr:hypothetical protein PR048_033095 [Dryococelus australis]
MLRKQQASQEMAAGSSKETVSEPANEEKVESSNEPVVTPSVETPPTFNPHKLICGLETFLVNENIAKAEILWRLQSVSVHFSMSAVGKTTEIFAVMFPDSQIAKMTYTIVHGLGPNFQLQVRNDVRDRDCFAVSFDESLNKTSYTKNGFCSEILEQR